MNPLKLTILAVRCLLAASVKIVTYSDDNYSSDTDVTISEGEVREYTNVRSLAINGQLENQGGIQVYARGSAIVSIRHLLNREKAFVSLNGVGDLTVAIQSQLTILESSFVEVVSKGNLKFTMGDIEQEYVNKGSMKLKSAQSLRFDALKPLVNVGEIRLESGGACFHRFGDIHNLHHIHIHSLSFEDFITVGKLINEGIFTYIHGPILGTAFEVREIVENTGQIGIYGLGGQGLVTQSLKVTNNGVLHLKNTVLYQEAVVRGNGCIVIGNSATLFVDLKYEFDIAQTIVLDDSSAFVELMSMTPSDKTIHLLGVRGNSRFLRFRHLIQSVMYDPITGLLAISLDSITYINFAIGVGYHADKFTATEFSVTYEGEVPDQVPSPLDCNCPFAPVIMT